MTFRRTPEALRDLEDCLVWSAANFGNAAARRYQMLIATALHEIATDPALRGSRRIDEFPPGIRLYHLSHSRKRAVLDGLVVKRPRHFVVYHVLPSGMVEILRVLHDSMDIAQHL